MSAISCSFGIVMGTRGPTTTSTVVAAPPPRTSIRHRDRVMAEEQVLLEGGATGSGPGRVAVSILGFSGAVFVHKTVG